MLDHLERGRESYRRRAWAEAFQSLAAADKESPLDVQDLELLATSSYLLGRDDDFLTTLDRAHHAYLTTGEPERAARCAFWVALSLLLRGEVGGATGWLARAQRLIEGHDCVERGYLLLPAVEQQLRQREYDAAYSAASEAVSIAERFSDADLIACARHLQGRALLQQGRVPSGLALLDEAMVAVTAGELSPIVTGLVYCSVIEACQQAYALSRAREWTSALARWCEQQPEMVAFTATCLVHRAEIMQLSGAWPDAIEEARRACKRQKPPAAAFYRQAEVHRLRGEFDAAEAAYRNASERGWEPQPGLCLLRLAQGRTDVAAAAIRRVVAATTEQLQRVKLLPAYVEILLAVSDIEEARIACRELQEIADGLEITVLEAAASHARGAVDLADGDTNAALAYLHRALQGWLEIAVPYEAARTRFLIGLACRELGDGDGCRMELDAARAAFERLGAVPDLARVDALTKRSTPADRAELTRRELQVLRLVATGKTNKSIATELGLSQKTIDRHVSNIFTKLAVSSRAAATAYAYEHDLV